MSRTLFRTSTIFTSHNVTVVRMNRKYNGNALSIGVATVANKKAQVYDARGPYPSIWRTLKPTFRFDWFVVLTSHLYAYILFCANDNNDDTIDYVKLARSNYTVQVELAI